MKIYNSTKRTETEIMELVKKALEARRAHACDVWVSDESTVYTDNGIHTQWDVHWVSLHLMKEDVLVRFFRYRQHSPCKPFGAHYQVHKPTGFEGVKVRANGYEIEVEY